jgi:beta-glucanase (GH16 family)
VSGGAGYGASLVRPRLTFADSPIRDRAPFIRVVLALDHGRSRIDSTAAAATRRPEPCSPPTPIQKKKIMNPSLFKSMALVFGLSASALVAAQTAQASFSDDLVSQDTSRWMKAGGWANGSPFNNAWLADHITFGGGTMAIRLDNVAAFGKPYSSDNYQSYGFYGYGCYEARFKPVAAAGVVSSFFTFAGPYDNGGNGKHNEIDIEFLGNNMRRFQVNFWTNNDAYIGGNEHLVDLAFDASLDYHQYAFKWTSMGIEWFVDGISVYKVLDSALKPTPKAADSLQKIMMNVWPVDGTAAGWAGTFVYPGAPLVGSYDSIRFASGENCAVSLPATVGWAPAEIHIQNMVPALINSSSQVTSKVTVVNGRGLPIQTAAVTGSFSGAVNGTAQGLTDSSGAVTLTSPKSTAAGNATFCVTQIIAAGLTYVSGANARTCVTIVK